TERRVDWADRWVFTRIARLALPELVSRNFPAWGLISAAGVLALLSVAAIARNWEGSGLLISLLSAAALATSGGMAALRGEESRARSIEWALLGLFGGVALACGWMERA